MDNTKETAVFGGGCFWCTEAVFKMLKGVENVTVGYSGGTVPNPSYEVVSEGDSAHVEVVKIIYDPKVIYFKDLLKIFFASHDPRSLDQQGADKGSQYRSVIFYSNTEQKNIAQSVIKEMEDTDQNNSPIVTLLKPFENFYVAENYHQNYYSKNRNAPYCQLVIDPKVEKIKSNYNNFLNKNDK